MQKKLLYTCLLIWAGLNTVSAQYLRQVTSTNKNDGGPFFILPQAAFKVNMAIVEFNYEAGDEFSSLLSLTPACTAAPPTVDTLKKDLASLEKAYGINAEVVANILLKKTKQTTYKLDKDMKCGTVSVADYDKVFMYEKTRGLSSSTLQLEYDANGILVKSNFTNESKVWPTVFAALSGLANVITAVRAVKADDGIVPTDITVGCVKIKMDRLQKIDALIRELDEHMSSELYNAEKPYVDQKQKLEEKIAKEFSALFYKKTMKSIPVELLYIFPKIRPNQPVKLFSFDKSSGKINLDDGNRDLQLATPFSRIVEVDLEAAPEAAKAYELRMYELPKQQDKAAAMKNLTGSNISNRIKAVFNVPKTERVVLTGPGETDAVYDSVVQVPQHGSLGYINRKLNALQLEYDVNGEIKTLSMEKKSPVDGFIGTGSGALKDIITAIKPEKAKTEIELLEEQAKKLELLKKIKELESQPEL